MRLPTWVGRVAGRRPAGFSPVGAIPLSNADYEKVQAKLDRQRKRAYRFAVGMSLFAVGANLWFAKGAYTGYHLTMAALTSWVLVFAIRTEQRFRQVNEAFKQLSERNWPEGG